MSKIKIEIKSWFNGSVLFEYESESATMRKAVEAAVADDANLRGANLSGANLSGANLSDADLSDADLSDANLSGADLSDADLSDADLSDADLSDANLSGANLSDADLSGANLSDADLSDADLSDANLSDADLSDATIYYADDDFDTEYRKDRLIRGTQLDEIETEMQHDVPSCRGYLVTWKNVLKIKSWKLKSADTATKAAPQAEEELHLMKDVTGRPEIAIGDTVAFKHGEAPHALRGEVLAIKDDEVVVGRCMLIGHETYILPTSDIYWIGRDEEADESEDDKLADDEA